MVIEIRGKVREVLGMVREVSGMVNGEGGLGNGDRGPGNGEGGPGNGDRGIRNADEGEGEEGGVGMRGGFPGRSASREVGLGQKEMLECDWEERDTE